MIAWHCFTLALLSLSRLRLSSASNLFTAFSSTPPLHTYAKIQHHKQPMGSDGQLAEQLYKQDPLQTGLFLGLWSGFISRSMHATLQWMSSFVCHAAGTRFTARRCWNAALTCWQETACKLGITVLPFVTVYVLETALVNQLRHSFQHIGSRLELHRTNVLIVLL